MAIRTLKLRKKCLFLGVNLHDAMQMRLRFRRRSNISSLMLKSLWKFLWSQLSTQWQIEPSNPLEKRWQLLATQPKSMTGPTCRRLRSPRWKVPTRQISEYRQARSLRRMKGTIAWAAPSKLPPSCPNAPVINPCDLAIMAMHQIARKEADPASSGWGDVALRDPGAAVKAQRPPPSTAFPLSTKRTLTVPWTPAKPPAPSTRTLARTSRWTILSHSPALADLTRILQPVGWGHPSVCLSGSSLILGRRWNWRPRTQNVRRIPTELADWRVTRWVFEQIGIYDWWDNSVWLKDTSWFLDSLTTELVVFVVLMKKFAISARKVFEILLHHRHWLLPLAIINRMIVHNRRFFNQTTSVGRLEADNNLPISEGLHCGIVGPILGSCESW